MVRSRIKTCSSKWLKCKNRLASVSFRLCAKYYFEPFAVPILTLLHTSTYLLYIYGCTELVPTLISIKSNEKPKKGDFDSRNIILSDSEFIQFLRINYLVLLQLSSIMFKHFKEFCRDFKEPPACFFGFSYFRSALKSYRGKQLNRFSFFRLD